MSNLEKYTNPNYVKRQVRKVRLGTEEEHETYLKNKIREFNK